MSRTRRALAPLVLATVLALAGCSGDSGSGASGDSGDGGEGSGSTEVSALGLAFDVPEGWETLDPEDAEIPEEEAAYLLAQDEEVVTVTVSTPDRAQSDEIGEGILASLTEAS